MEVYNHVKKLIFIGALCGYLIVSLFGIIHITHMAEMDMPMQNCPLALGTHALCQMSGALHEKVWKSFSVAVLFNYILTLAVAFFALFSFTICFSSPSGSSPQNRHNRARIIPLFRDLFSRGILNPKAP
jgi:hypothetical protein